MRPSSGCLRFFLLATISLPALAGAPSGQADLDEVTVSGERVKIEALRKQIVQLEDHFYDRYNELNTVDDFDIHCIEEARTGTRFIKRSCRAVYQERALAEEAREAFKAFQRLHPQQGNTPLVDGGPPMSATNVIQRRLPEYRKNLEEVARRDPELTRLLQERGKLIESYDAALKKTWGLKPQPEVEPQK